VKPLSCLLYTLPPPVSMSIISRARPPGEQSLFCFSLTFTVLIFDNIVPLFATYKSSAPTFSICDNRLASPELKPNLGVYGYHDRCYKIVITTHTNAPPSLNVTLSCFASSFFAFFSLSFGSYEWEKALLLTDVIRTPYLARIDYDKLLNIYHYSTYYLWK
jgi:hypothetical protein